MRVFLGGRGFPREEFALSGEASEVSPETPIVLILENGEVFNPGDYSALGFTHFDAWVVGASGGRGGGSRSLATFQVTETNEVMPADLWDLFVEGRWREAILKYYVDGLPPSTLPPYATYPDYDAIRAALEAANPSHTFKVRTYHDPQLSISSSQYYYVPGTAAMPINVGMDVSVGAPPGGGGLQVASGALTDLPTEVDVVVGQVGADGAPGQTRVNGLWYPDPVVIYWTYGAFPGEEGNHHPDVSGWSPGGWALDWRRLEILHGLIPWLVRYPSPVGFPIPQGAYDGGYSAFGDVAKASGGKGGGPAKVWDGSKFVAPEGNGGAGGVGNSIVAGGGGAASAVLGIPGKDGLWNPATKIGQGGGAGARSAAGGRGSWSYADTTVYGASDTGGAGGGAKIMRKYFHGSEALKYDPDGAVILRIYRVG